MFVLDKNHHFSKFAVFRRFNRAHQELSFKNNSRKKCFFLCRLMECKSFSMLIILVDRWQVLSYLIRVPLLNQANYAIWQKLWFTSIVLTVFPGVWKWMPPMKKKELVRFSSSTPRQKKTTESFCRQRVGFEINRERQGSLPQSRKMAKKWQSP